MTNEPSDITTEQMRALASEWLDLDLQASLTEAEMARYDKLPMLMAHALQAAANWRESLKIEVAGDLEAMRERVLAAIAARDELLGRAQDVLEAFGVCADDWREKDGWHAVNERGLEPVYVKDLRAAQALAAEIEAALGASSGATAAD